MTAHLMRRPAFLRDTLPSGGSRQAALAMLRYFLFTQEGTNLVGGLNKLHCGAAVKKQKPASG